MKTIKQHRNHKACMLLAVAALAVSCLGGEDFPTHSSETDHLLLVYMGGDNNLWDEVEQKTAAMQQGWNRKGNDRLVIFSDTAGGEAILTEIKGADGGNTRQTIKNYGDVNSADGKIISQVISDVTKRYNAGSYGLVVFSHATGWLPAGAYENPEWMQIKVEDWVDIPVDVDISLATNGSTRSIITDGRDQGEINQFAMAIPDGMFEFIVFEACLMASVEVAFELKDKTEYIMASSAEILSPGFTDAYYKYTDLLFEGDIERFAKNVFDHFDSKSGVERSATISLIKTSELDNLAEWIAENCDMRTPVDIEDIQKFNRHPDGYGLVFDFYDYYAMCTDREKAGELAGILEKCVVWKNATPDFLHGRTYGFKINEHCGMTAYIHQKNFSWINTAHRQTKWCLKIRNK